MKTYLTYTDRDGRFWCRLEGRGQRVWASDSVGEHLAIQVAQAVFRETLNASGDFVPRLDGRLVRLPPGRSPHTVCRETD